MTLSIQSLDAPGIQSETPFTRRAVRQRSQVGLPQRPLRPWKRGPLAPGRGDDGFETPRWGQDEPEPDFPGRELLRGKSAMEVLEKLYRGDPLELLPRARERVRTQAVMLGGDSLFLRTVARLAQAAHGYRGVPVLDEWIGERMDGAMRDLLTEDRESELVKAPFNVDADPRYRFLSDAFGIEPTHTRRACNEFNALPKDMRQTFLAVFIEGKSIRDWETESRVTSDQIKRQLRKSLYRIGVRREVNLEQLEGKGFHES